MKEGLKALMFLTLLTSAACKSKRPIVILNPDLPARSPEKLLDRLLARGTDTLRYYSAKAVVDLELPSGKKSFKAQVRSVRDSAVWVSVIPALGIEAARALLTPDSLKLMDRLNDRFFVGDTADAAQKFGLQPSLFLLQEALLGKAIGLDPEIKYRSDREEGFYVLTSKERRKFVRAAEDISPSDTLEHDRDMKDKRLERTLRKAEEKEAIVLRYWIEPNDFSTSRVQIVDLVHDQIAEVRYEERGGAEQHFLPTRIRITLSGPEGQATGTLDLSRIQREGPLQMNFRIPDKFTPLP
ncbi:MAG TPA: DUF4292 domain-containing protein [Flavobacteriales bacterium]|jgi:hypothetical protein|nr:DUF4292 domain-containing protein [Flavobacteriales bacterium]MBK6550396.1 DUF4292 domain-containing protein [Flavobacteriales bacterium]MBK7102756.1 DUF4292 domain-containing protein [Flavobacteriales bacterium]MBK7482377.1 DUF4292 domain-containing protein [Flavobacteriales bacterium]MBK8531000.1 DUF4292 domain-containing protein [Flavobacteriales bacterium]